MTCNIVSLYLHRNMDTRVKLNNSCILLWINNQKIDHLLEKIGQRTAIGNFKARTKLEPN